MAEKASSIQLVSHHNEQDYLTSEDRQLLRKVDLRLVFLEAMDTRWSQGASAHRLLPILTTLYLFSFLDRCVFLPFHPIT